MSDLKRRSDFIPRESKTCEHCGEVFECPPNWPRPVWLKARFCSRTCASKVVHRTDEEARFDALVGPQTDTGCRLWQGTVSSHGYGQIRLNGRLVFAHRHAFERVHGLIPRGLMVCHRCDVRLCVNVEHHFLGTGAENNADAAAKGRTALGEKNGSAKLTADDVASIRASSLSATALAVAYGVSRPAIANVLSRKTWGHVP